MMHRFEILPLFRSVLLVTLALLAVGCGDEDWETVNAEAKAAAVEGDNEKARQRFEDALQIAEKFGPEDPRLVQSLNNLGLLLRTDDMDRALELFARAVELREQQLGPDNEELLASYREMALYYQNAGRLDDAEASLRKEHDLIVRVGGEDDPRLAVVLSNIGMLNHLQGAYDDAEASFARSVELIESAMILDSPVLLAVWTNMAQTKRARGEYDAAIELHRKVIENARMNRGADSIEVARAHRAMAEDLKLAGRLREAADACREALTRMEAIYPQGHREVALTMAQMAAIHRADGRTAEAVQAYQNAVGQLSREGETPGTDLAVALFNLARLHRENGRLLEAEPLVDRSLKLFEELLGPSHPNVVSVLELYAEVLEGLDRADEASRLSSRAAEIRAAG